MKSQRYDDRIDADTRISNLEVIGLVGRSLRFLWPLRRLASLKFALMLLSLVPLFFYPFLPKIIVDHVILARSFDSTEIPFPPHIEPFVSFLSGKTPMEIMVSVVVFGLALLLLFSKTKTEIEVAMAQGEDSATQSENAMNAGHGNSGSLLGVLEALIQVRISQGLTNLLRTRLFKHMSRLPMTTLNDQRTGDTIYRVMYDSPMIPGLCYQILFYPLLLILSSSISIYLLYFSYSDVLPEIVFSAACLVPIALIITIPLSALARHLQQDSRSAGSATTNSMEESLSQIEAVQSLGGMTKEIEEFSSRSQESYLRFRLIKILEIALVFLSLMLIVALLFYGARVVGNLIIDGVMSPGDFWVIGGLIFQLGGAAFSIGAIWITIQGNVAAVRRVFFFFDLETEEERADQTTLKTLERSIEFEDVSFSYPGGSRVISNFTTTMRKGKLIAMVGPTGSGKTTLAQMVPGYLIPTSGRILFDGVDLRQVNLDSLREQVSYVFQEHLLLSESIRDNLLLANPKAEDDQIQRALEVSGSIDFVNGLPNGLDTILGRSGDTLSVGQQQRLSIARGLLRDTPILILDEPTASLDLVTEQTLISNLLDKLSDRLVIIIAHRLSTIRMADQILFFNDGRLEDSGTHEELISKEDGPYRQFVELQRG